LSAVSDVVVSAVVAGAVSLVVTFGKIAWDGRQKKQDRQLAAREKLDRYREPLLTAADGLGADQLSLSGGNTTIYVSDLHTSVQFYTESVGLRLLARVAESWALERTADAYLKFSAAFAPLKAALQDREALSDSEAFTARILLIHHYRRIVLRDPLLPADLLPSNWPGRQARALCGEIYRLLLPGSERWLDAHATNDEGPLPPAGRALLRRFAATDDPG